MAPTNSANSGRPRRPKRAPTGYNIFMKKFMKSQCISSREDAKNAIKAGAKLWSKMSGSEKEKYGKQSTRYRAKYEAEMSDYRRQLQAFKAPPRPFAAFCKDYYNGGQFELAPGDSENVISQLSRCASVAWHNLQPSQRHEYTRRFQSDYQDHKTRLSGGTVLLNAEAGSPSPPVLTPQIQANRSAPSASARGNVQRVQPQEAAPTPSTSSRSAAQKNIHLDSAPAVAPVLTDQRLQRKSARLQARRKSVKKTLRFSGDNDLLRN